MKKIDLQEINDEVIRMFTTTVQGVAKDYLQEATQDAQIYLKESEERLKQWSMELANQEMTQEEFQFLLESQKKLAKMKYLTQKGLAKIHTDSLKNNLMQAIFQTVIKKASQA